jgi:hypothetical protein
VTDPRDDEIERLLRREMRRDPESKDACLDPGTLAAFAEGALARRERAAVEAHAADCSRCLALLATMAQVQEPAPQPSRWRRPMFVRWAVPAAIGATAVAVTIYVGQDPRIANQPPRVDAAESVRASPPPAPATPPPPSAQVPPARDAVAAPATASARKSSQTNPAARETPKSAEARAGQTSLPVAQLPPLREEVGEAQTARAGNRAAAPPAARPASPPPVPVASAAASKPELADEVRFDALARTVAGQVHVQSPDRTVAWRLTGRTVERSTDGGVTWTVEPTPPSASLRAGSSPGVAVCWLVGDAGTVLLWVDGQGWRRLAFPETGGLVAVAASSGRAAEVTTADKRRFRTDDGGQTWVEIK